MKTRMLGVLAAGALLGATLATAGLAQDRLRGFDGHGAGTVRGPHATVRERVRDNNAPASAERFIARLDTDDDGRVGAAEFIAARLQQADRYFERRDTDGDGLVSAAEFDASRAPPERNPPGTGRGRPAIDEEALAACVRATITDVDPRSGGEAADPFATTDTNADGALSLQEVSAALEGRAQQQFARMDTDGDGFITADETIAQREERMELRRMARTCLGEQRPG